MIVFGLKTEAGRLFLTPEHFFSGKKNPPTDTPSTFAYSQKKHENITVHKNTFTTFNIQYS